MTIPISMKLTNVNFWDMTSVTSIERPFVRKPFYLGMFITANLSNDIVFCFSFPCIFYWFKKLTLLKPFLGLFDLFLLCGMWCIRVCNMYFLNLCAGGWWRNSTYRFFICYDFSFKTLPSRTTDLLDLVNCFIIIISVYLIYLFSLI